MGGAFGVKGAIVSRVEAPSVMLLDDDPRHDVAVAPRGATVDGLK